ncbi:MAG: tetratricopeptide repeat protein [Geothrix sp.]|uniref:tetratricopeptide repeat protein n=1 Tax=Geothrix sp. TaxID=1962974 RepID=UPI001808BB40|nr:tetratricopeptide repeat protein [Geothrix sp.]NWJ42341.1 tetratricopeptide repeat protein [Geothrix sp.]WIL19692.1 MAG: tetratricopeptide repeat protein [Geothrix sp.]
MSDFRASLLVVLLAGALASAEDVRALMLQARALQLRGGGADPTAAAALYRRVLAQVPESAEANLRLSEALQEAQDADAAVAPARKAVELAPQNAEAQAHLALLQFQRAQKDAALAPEAIRELKAATLRLPQDPELWARLGEASETVKDGEGALRAWLRLGRMRPSFGPAWERAFIHARATQNYEGKREALLALNARHPEDRHLRLLEELAREQIKAGYLAHAEESFLLLASHVPQEAGLWENVSLVRIQTARWTEALETLAKAEALKPSPTLTFHTARALMNLGRFEEAERRLRGIVSQEIEPQWIGDGAPMLYAESLLLQGKGRALLAFLKDRRPRPHTDGEAQVFKTQACISLNDWKSGLDALKEGIARYPKVPFFQQAAKLPPRYLEYAVFSRKETRAALEQLHLEGMAALWQEFQRWDKCLEALERARTLSPVRRVDMLIMQSQAYDQLDRHAESLAVLREAQALEPANPLVQNNLGYLLLEQDRDLEEAAALIEASAKATPDNGNVVDSLGWAQFKLGRVAEAEATLRRAAELSPFSPEVRKHLGEVLVKQGKLAEAAEQWDRALAFVFPDRSALEKRLGDLRIRIAKEQAAKLEAPTATPATPAVKPDDDEDDQ